MSTRAAPRATYRLQLGSSLTFDGARRLVPYLQELGISHLYLSPVLQARHGSSHGYDVVDPRRVSEELGGAAELRALCEAGLEIVLDVVPNHMAADDEQNPFWRDLDLRRRFFDLDDETGAARRFFDVDELAGVRVEDPHVFEICHRVVLDLVADGLVAGLRIDHIDGLADPRGYLERLSGSGVGQIWVEKILQPVEELRDWPVLGTTGYEFARDVQALFVDPAAERLLTELSGEQRPFSEVAHQAKLEQVRTTFQPEVDRLRRLVDAPELEEALAALHVYRTYVEPASRLVDDRDRQATAHLPEPIRRILMLDQEAPGEFVTRFQQTSGSVMAKGVEDTAFYRYVRLLALNEVGGDPGQFGIDVATFHAANTARARRFPHALLAGTTHDSKRSADVRARLGTLSNVPERWAEHALRWRELNRPLRQGAAPDWTEELLIYQTLLGAWPLGPERLSSYVQKALYEEKRHSSWVEPDERWDSSVAHFCHAIYANGRFLSDFEPFAQEITAAGERAAVGQLVLRLTSPGVPDTYNGDELWYLALVDPDNRRPTDFDRARDLLAGLAAGGAPARETVKLFVLWTLLGLRRRHPEAFSGPYEPLASDADTCAFRRGDDIVVAVPIRGDMPAFDEPSGRWRNVLTGIEASLGGYRPCVLERR
ncbi:MAG: alpha-amylase family glycosyl hydrolase [Gaiellaceae bacterium]